MNFKRLLLIFLISINFVILIPEVIATTPTKTQLELKKLQAEIKKLNRENRYSEIKFWLSVLVGFSGSVTVIWTVIEGLRGFKFRTEEQQVARISRLLENFSHESQSVRLGAVRALTFDVDKVSDFLLAVAETETSITVRQAIATILAKGGKKTIRAVVEANARTLPERTFLLGRLEQLENGEQANFYNLVSLNPDDIKILLKRFRTSYQQGKFRNTVYPTYFGDLNLEESELKQAAIHSGSLANISNLVISKVLSYPKNTYLLDITYNLFKYYSKSSIIKLLFKYFWGLGSNSRKKLIKGELDLSGSNLYSIYLISFNLNNSLLSNSLLRHSVLLYSNINKSNFIGASCYNIKIQNCILIECNFTKSNFRESEIKFSNLERSNFREVVFSEATLNYVSFKNSNFEKGKLKGCDITEVDFQECSLEECQMQGAKLVRCQLSEVKFYRANFTEAVIKDVIAQNAKFNGANAKSCRFQDSANLTGADFSGADLTKADFSGANLTEAIFKKANLTRADFSGADLTKADFSGAN
ncbi:MAG: pentapeptide repeat-containing protein, partial [Halothece sp. Uz-M2-17]|nr:pentapeptide repeat-containing protein [Halothece sp. Uz-M2-17]